jgi:aminoglycoside/choline kinase family phosphotransferase
LVSLLKDCYIQWPRAQVLEWLEYYSQQSEKLAGAANQAWQAQEQKTLIRDFDLMGMQRHLKAAGIFARLSIRDGKHGYLEDVPRTCDYLIQTARLYPEFSDFVRWMEGTFLPALKDKSNAKVMA